MRAAVAPILILVACGGGGGFPDAPVKHDATLPPGTIKVAWSLTDDTGAPITCDQVGAITMTATLRSPSIVGGQTQVFTCGVLMGESQAVDPNTYNIDFELDNASGAIAQAPRASNIIVRSNQATQLDPLVFAVVAKGNLALHVTANKPGGNCAPTASNGGGITATTITLVHKPGDACEPLTLNVGASALTGAPASTYVVNCTTPTVAPCIENDQAITTTASPSGNYQIHIRGQVGTPTCWTNDDQFAIPAANQTLTRTLNLGYSASTPGC